MSATDSSPPRSSHPLQVQIEGELDPQNPDYRSLLFRAVEPELEWLREQLQKRPGQRALLPSEAAVLRFYLVEKMLAAREAGVTAT